METTAWAAAALKLLVWGALVAADLDLPPPRYDHPYPGQVLFLYDYPQYEDRWLWGYTDAPIRKGAPCMIHLSPIGSVIENQVMTEGSLHILIRHEIGHCNGWRHRGGHRGG